MVTPMVTNLKKVVTSDSELVDPRIYRKLIGSLMYLVNTKTIFFFYENLELAHGGVEEGALHSSETCA